MKNLITLSAYAIRLPGVPANCAVAGCFDVPIPATGMKVRVIASAVFGWDHVSVSLKKRCPNWPEMSRVKALFFEDNECAMQLHVPVADHINNHPYCLHLWRPHHVAIPRPPADFVGVRDMTPEQANTLTWEQRLALADSTSDTLERAVGGVR